MSCEWQYKNNGSYLLDWLIDSNDMSTHLGLFYAKRFGNYVHYTFIFIGGVLKVKSNTNNSGPEYVLPLQVRVCTLGVMVMKMYATLSRSLEF